MHWDVCYALKKLESYASFVLSNLPLASITPWLHAARLPFLNLILRRVRQRVRDFFKYLVMLARKPGPFWRENVLAVVTLLRVFARMSKWRKQFIKC